MGYKEVKLEKGGGKALYGALSDSNAATIAMGKALRAKKPATTAKKAPAKGKK